MTASGGSPRQIVHMQPMSKLPARQDGYTRFVLLSDTHTHTFKVPPGDFLLHAGDLTEYGDTKELQKTVDWLCSLPHKHKVMIAGNHDYCLDEATLISELSRYNKNRNKGTLSPEQLEVRSEIYDKAVAILDSPQVKEAGLIYLNDEMCEVQAREGGKRWKIWGSPWSAAFCSMAFNVPRGDLSTELYSRIPDETDILMSHGPPYGILDRIKRDKSHVGCDKLLTRTKQIKPRLHVWGHIHEDRGVIVDDGSSKQAGTETGTGTVYVNAANAGTFARPRLWGTGEYQPIVIDLKDEV